MYQSAKYFYSIAIVGLNSLSRPDKCSVCHRSILPLGLDCSRAQTLMFLIAAESHFSLWPCWEQSPIFVVSPHGRISVAPQHVW